MPTGLIAREPYKSYYISMRYGHFNEGEARRSFGVALGYFGVLLSVLWCLSGCGTEQPPADAGQSIAFSDLPSEARTTIALIRQGGQLPYRKDGAVFFNREGLLPRAERGYYREYTVRTPGVSGRGARRLVGGQAGEFYYTADHYRSFKRVRE